MAVQYRHRRHPREPENICCEVGAVIVAMISIPDKENPPSTSHTHTIEYKPQTLFPPSPLNRIYPPNLNTLVQSAPTAQPLLLSGRLELLHLGDALLELDVLALLVAVALVLAFPWHVPGVVAAFVEWNQEVRTAVPVREGEAGGGHFFVC